MHGKFEFEQREAIWAIHERLPVGKVHTFREGHKILRNLRRRFVLCSASQICSGDFATFVAFSEYMILEILI